METLADANAAKEAQRLNNECSYHTLHSQLIAEKCIHSLEDNDIYLEQWYQVCAGLFKLMGWDVLNMSPEMDDTIINAW